MTPLTRALCSPYSYARRATFRTKAEIARDHAAARRVAEKHKGGQSARRAALAADLDALTLRALNAGGLS